ncbi:MAG TPA: anthranilate synthase component I [Thermoanaerobaculia bacterium]|jgi:anthranilate synthase component 1|nr:anthranilate synthase component I [Thermoanaerobaculia bacterium]
MDFDVIPVVRTLSADTLTPLVAFAALSGGDSEAFLFESVERGENLGRYSFVGFEPRRNLRFDATVADPVRVLNEELVPLHVKDEHVLPPFFGGAVGYFGYGVGGWSERIPDSHANDTGIPDAKLLFFDNVVVFDHVQQRMHVVANVFRDGTIDDANKRLDRAIEKLRRASVEPIAFDPTASVAFTANHTRESFEQLVRDAKEEIVAGEIFQVVLSQRWETEYPTREALTLYRALRSINPSPYMFLLRTDECTLVGASPEMLVRVKGRKVETRPIAGTRPRGKTHDEDRELEAALLADPKENAEHLMLVDLGRNDLGRVCATGTIVVEDFKHIERYSHVMHIVTDVHGQLREDYTPVDAFLSCFPAGTVSGAPKIRAMELIDRFESTRRGPYAGAVAYFSFNGNLDSCITIRTVVLANDRAYVQAGAGIVSDSDPATEYVETENKSMALRRAISVAKAALKRGEKS